MAHCRNCGSILREGEPFCPHCGQKVVAETEAETANTSYTEAEFEVEDDASVAPSVTEKPAAEPFRSEPQKQAEPTQQAKTFDAAPITEPPRGSTIKEAQPEEPEPKKKCSGLSIAAFICSLTILLSGLGIILAIVDLVKSRNQPRKKGLSIAALVIGGIVMLLAFIGNNIDLETLLEPKEETFAEIRGGTVYAADGFEVTVGDHNWVLEKSQNNLLVFCPAAEKEQKGGPATSIWVAEINYQKSPDEYAEFALETERNSISAKPKSLKVNGDHKGVWAEGKHGDRTTRIAVWTAGNRMFTVAYYGVGLDADGEAVYREILDSFVPTPKETASSQASQEVAPQAAQEEKPDVPAAALSDRVVSLSLGDHFVLGLRENGTVSLLPDIVYDHSEFGKVSEWRDLAAVETETIYSTFILGLKKDGTVVCLAEKNLSGYSSAMQEIKTWHDIVSIEAGIYAAYGIQKDGTVKIARFDPEKIDHYRMNDKLSAAEKWSNLIALKEIGTDLYGITADGSVLSTSLDMNRVFSKIDMLQIADLDGYYIPTGILRDDGGVVNLIGICQMFAPNIYDIYHRYDLPIWTDIKKILVFEHHALGLKNDGTVESVRSDSASYADLGQDQVSGWTDIIDIVGNTYTTIGLKEDGTLVLAGIDSGFNLTAWK